MAKESGFSVGKFVKHAYIWLIDISLCSGILRKRALQLRNIILHFFFIFPRGIKPGRLHRLYLGIWPRARLLVKCSRSIISTTRSQMKKLYFTSEIYSFFCTITPFPFEPSVPMSTFQEQSKIVQIC